MSGIERYRKLLIARPARRHWPCNPSPVSRTRIAQATTPEPPWGILAYIQLARRIWLERAERLTSAPVPDWFPASPPEQTAKLAAGT